MQNVKSQLKHSFKMKYKIGIEIMAAKKTDTYHSLLCLNCDGPYNHIYIFMHDAKKCRDSITQDMFMKWSFNKSLQVVKKHLTADELCMEGVFISRYYRSKRSPIKYIYIQPPFSSFMNYHSHILLFYSF